MFKFLRHYSRKEIQKALVEQAKDKEIGVRYRETFGKRPDTLQFESDIFEFARKGATSFHLSEETWVNPLNLSTGLTKKQLDDQRKGWDFIIDIDCPYWEYSKLTAYLLVEALKFNNIQNVSVKFSGNKGFHLGVPFEAFPEEVNGKPTKDLYPESLKVMAEYLQEMIRPLLIQKILEKENIRDIVLRTGKSERELTKEGEFDPFTIIDIDTILISSRHLYRAAYSLHEKSGLVSIPIDPNKVLEFEKSMAEPEKVDLTMPFMDRSLITDKEAKELIIQAFDWHSKIKIKEQALEQHKEESEAETKIKEYEIPTKAITEDKFPTCIKKILQGNMEDGKKRGLFVLLRFLRNVGWNSAEIEKKVREWNKTNPQPLSETYIITQLTWHKRQKETILPPNCTKDNYYKDMQLCPGSIACVQYKNPVNYTKSQAKIESIKKKVKRTKGTDSNVPASRE